MPPAATPSRKLQYRWVGPWRSLVARFLGVEEVPSSNLGGPTNDSKNLASPTRFSSPHNSRIIGQFTTFETVSPSSRSCTRRTACSRRSSPTIVYSAVISEDLVLFAVAELFVPVLDDRNQTRSSILLRCTTWLRTRRRLGISRRDHPEVVRRLRLSLSRTQKDRSASSSRWRCSALRRGLRPARPACSDGKTRPLGTLRSSRSLPFGGKFVVFRRGEILPCRCRRSKSEIPGCVC